MMDDDMMDDDMMDDDILAKLHKTLEMQNMHSNNYCYLAPEGAASYSFHPVLSVCVFVCLCVSGQYFGIVFLGYWKRYRSETYTGYV